MLMRWWDPRSLALGLLLFQATTAAAEPPAATMTAPELRAALRKAQDAIQSLFVVYTSDDYDESRYAKGHYLHRTIAAKAPDSLLHMTAHGDAVLPWIDDPYQQRARVRNGHLFNEYPFNRSYFEQDVDLKKDGLPGTLPQEFLFIATGVWPPTGVKPPRPVSPADPYVLKEVASSESYTQVRPRLESVAGRWCHVLERPGKDRLWIDVERGCALMARETHAATTGRLAQRIELGGHREVRPGIWFPMEMTNIRYDHDASGEEKQGRVWKNAKHEVLEVHINDVDDAVFQWEPPPGALCLPDDTLPFQSKPGGIEHIAAMASWVRRHHRLSTPQSATVLPMVGGAILVGLLIVFLPPWKDRLLRNFGPRRIPGWWSKVASITAMARKP
jgi:hypothetical protein